MQTDKDGRRLFLSSEFHASNRRHKKQDLNTYLNDVTKKNVSIIDKEVFDRHGRNVALPKNGFADYILQEEEGFNDFDVSEFSKIFDVIAMIMKENSPEG